MGSPDFIQRTSKKLGRFHVWSEVWDYDGPDATTRLIWSYPESSRREAVQQRRRLVRVEVSPAGWRDLDRLLSMLGLRT